MDELKTIRSFVLIVTSGSLAKAAQKLGTSRGLVTRHLSSLETRLGTRLINRTTRRIALTETGTIYYEFCTRMLRDLEKAQEAVRDLHVKPAGAIRVVAPRSFATLYLADAVAEFARQHPDIHITLSLNDTAASLSNVGSDDFDVAIRLSRLADDSSAIARKIGALEWIICASPAYLAKHGEPKVPEDLSRANCALLTTTAPELMWQFGTGRKSKSVKVRGTFRSNSVLALKSAALAGIGIAEMPTCYVVEDLRSGRLRRIAIQPPLEARPVYAVLPDNRRIPKRTQVFLNFIARWYRSRRWDRVS